MILLLGATTYAGQAFARALRRRKDSFIPLSRHTFDYTRFEFLFDYVRKIKPDLLINADECDGTVQYWSHGATANENRAVATPVHGHTQPLHPPFAEEESDRLEMLQANTLLPQTIARVCQATNTAWGHVSSGSIFCGAKLHSNGSSSIEEDLSLPAVRSLFAAHPERFQGFSELDQPNFSFKAPPCSFYSGTKALAEEALLNARNYIWRLHLPFNELDLPANFLSQLQDAPGLHEAINSFSQLDECVNACLDLWELRAPFGIYHVVNPGAVGTSEIVHLIQRILQPRREFQLLIYEDDGNPQAVRVLRSHCILDPSKLLNLGIKLCPVRQALVKSLEKWQPRSSRLAKTPA